MVKNVVLLEAEIAEGLESIVRDELKTRFGKAVKIGLARKDALQFTFSGDLRRLHDLKTVIAVYLLQSFNISRPKALLGHQNFHLLLGMIESVRGLLSPSNSYRTLYIDAAGSDSSVLTRLKHDLAKETNLIPIDEKGDLLIRLRRSWDGEGWDALVRLSSRPLVTRQWRVCNFEGALNASVAHAMVQLTRPTVDDVFLNLVCGSGSLLIERLNSGGARQMIGCDFDGEVLACARLNIVAAGDSSRIRLMQADARQLPLADACADKLVADLPFGQLVGSHQENATLYPAVLCEAARVARDKALFVVITHEIRLMESVLKKTPEWGMLETIRVTLGGLHPRIYLLQKT
jgi:tRNA (guanine6-N2)-methyltransferase